MKGVMHFGSILVPLKFWRGYSLALPPEMESVHPIFHISMIRKYILDPSHVIRAQ